jgi:(p)ppGpp synthase/HD superfamily hydrolase
MNQAIQKDMNMTLESVRDQNKIDGPIRLQKQKVLFRGYFLGREMHQSVRAMEIAMECHSGFRKDGSPEVSHQFEIVGMLLQIFEGRMCYHMLDSLVSAAFLHDVPEDYPELYNLAALAEVFNEVTMSVVTRMTKPEGFEKTDEHRKPYFNFISEDILAVLLKCADRVHNLQSMIAGFSNKKQLEYIEETETYFYPMIKKARLEYSEFYMILVLFKQQMAMIIRSCKYNLEIHQRLLSEIQFEKNEKMLSASSDKSEPIKNTEKK